MRARITWLAASLVAGVVCAFVVPLALLVQQMSLDAAVAGARDEAQRVAIAVAGVQDAATLRSLVSGPATSVLLPDGTRIGDGASDARVAGVAASGRGQTVVGADRVDVYVPVGLAEGTAVVHAGADLTGVRRGITLAWAILGVLAAGLIAVSVAVARRLSQAISTPVTDMADVAGRLRAGDLTARATLRGPAEIAALGGALNRLADRIVELVAVEREAAADLSHRLRTPVTALRLDSELVTDPAVRERLQGHVAGLQHAIDSVVAEARRPVREPLPGSCDAASVVADRAAHWAPLAEDQGREVRVRLPGEAVGVRLSGRDLSDLVDNLLDNVFAHTAEGVAYAVTLAAEAEAAVLTVEDAGAAGPEGVLTARGASGGNGSGLGLDIVGKLARASGGGLTVEPSGLGGVAVVVRLGRAEASGSS